jgi:hypothetical protein
MPGYISEVDYDGGANSNFIEIAIPKGTDTSSYTVVIYSKNGTIIETFSLGPIINTMGQHDVYLIDSSTPNWIDLHNNEAVALVDDSNNVLQFIAFKDPVTAVEGPANGMSATQIGEHSGSNQSLVTSNRGASYSPTPTSDPGTIPCYAPGTLIDTPQGPRPVETLGPGDLVLTHDHGAQPVRWVRSGDQALDSLPQDGRPVLIRAGALGPGLPNADLIVSPQHRILVGGHGQLQPLADRECFVPAKALTGLPGIRFMRGKRRITWVHFACDRHHVVTANGCRSESLLLGPMVLNAMNQHDRHALMRAFGAIPAGRALNGAPVRPCLGVSEVARRLRLRSFHTRLAA